MVRSLSFNRARRGGTLFAAALAGSMLLPLAGQAAAPLPFATDAPVLDRPAVAEPRLLVAQNQAAEALVRIQDLEEQIRTLTGQVEGLQFQLTQMQTLIERMTEDNEFRFQQLEGGAVGKPQAAAPTEGATPSDRLPQTPAPTAEQAPSATLPPLTGDAPMDQIGESRDPLLGGGSDQLGTLSEEESLSLGQSRPLDLSLGGQLSNGDADAQYAAGYDAMTRGDYAFAEDQFQQFIALYPDDPQAPDATNWLGEALIQRGAYTDAAQVLADGYTKYRESKRAPDIMLKLGIALAGADQLDVACRTFYTLKQRYPALTPAFQQRLAEENQKARCPVG